MSPRCSADARLQTIHYPGALFSVGLVFACLKVENRDVSDLRDATGGKGKMSKAHGLTKHSVSLRGLAMLSWHWRSMFSSQRAFSLFVTLSATLVTMSVSCTGHAIHNETFVIRSDSDSRSVNSKVHLPRCGPSGLRHCPRAPLGSPRSLRPATP